MYHTVVFETEVLQTSNARRIILNNKMFDDSDVVVAAPVQLHLHSRLNTCLEYIRQRQLQAEMRNI